MRIRQKNVITKAKPISADHLQKKLSTALAPPSDRQGIASVLHNAAACVKELQKALESTQAVDACCRDLALLMSDLGISSENVVGPQYIRSKLSAWRLFAFLSADSTDPLVRLAAAVDLVDAWSRHKPVPPARARDLLARSTSRSSLTVTEFLERRQDSLSLPYELQWLERTDSLLRLLTQPSATKKDVNFDFVATSQWEDAARHARSHQRAWVLDHRCLSPGELDQEVDLIGTTLRNPATSEWAAAMVIASMAGLTADLLHEIPLGRGAPHKGFAGWIDIDAGTFHIDLSVLAPEASVTGRHSATLVSTRPLPEAVAEVLRRRFTQVDSARVLGDLLPDLERVTGNTRLEGPIADVSGSWAQWIQSAPVVFQSAGCHPVLACLLSANFSGIARSKTHYQRVPSSELWDAADDVFNALGWGAPVDRQVGLLDFGVPATPKLEDIAAADTYLGARAIALQPGRRAPTQYLIDHHNAVMLWAAFRLKLALCLRESTTLHLSAADLVDRPSFVFLEDKRTGGRDKYLPTLVPRSAAQVVERTRVHARHLANRLRAQCEATHLTEWATAVAEGRNVPLLCLIGKEQQLVDMGTRHFMEVLPPELSLAPDFGRKFLENTLRQQGLENRLIDLVLRHEVTGSEAHSSVADLPLGDQIGRATAAVDAALRPCLGRRFRGLVSSSLEVLA